MKTSLKNLFVVGAASALAFLFIGSAATAQNLYVSYADGGVVNIFSSTASETLFPSGFFLPVGVAFDGAGDLYVADFGYRAVYEFSPAGVKSTFVNSSEVGNPEALAFDNTGNLYVGDYASGHIWEFAPNGAQSSFASGLSFPLGIAIDSSNDVFVAVAPVFGPRVVYKFTPAGAQSTFASGLNAPGPLAMDGANNLYVADPPFIYKYTPDGTQSTFATNTDAFALACDPYGNIFDADGAAGVIYEYTPSGAQSTFATGVIGNYMAFNCTPILKIKSNGTNCVALSWSAFYTGYTLEQSPAVNPPNWSPCANATNFVNGSNQVIISPTCSQMFFQLVAQ